MSTGEDQTTNVTLVSVQVALGRIEGILQTIVTEHARRISDNEETTRKLRADLTAVKDEAAKALADYSREIQKKWDDGTREGMKAFSEVTGTLASHTTTINDIKEDVRSVQDKQHNGLSRAAVILSPVISVGALIWSIVIHH